MDRSRTDELLVSFLRTEPDRIEPTGVGELSNADWDDLLRTSARHGVAPLLYHRLSTSRTGAPIPEEVMLSLRNSYLQSAARNMKLYHELGKVLGKLRQDDIPVIALKGAHLAEIVYGNIALRPMGDVDLLVRKEDLGRVEEILLGMGYLPAECNRQISTDNCHFVYKLAGKGLSVEVHWAFMPSNYRFEIDMDGVWERSRPCVLAGVEVSVLCPEDQLLYLCLHTSKHLFDDMGLKPLYDISSVIRHYGEEMDWNQVQSRCEQWGTEKSVYVALTLAGEIFGVTVPNDLMKAVQPVDLDERFMAFATVQIFACGRRTSDGLSLSSNVAHLFGSHRRKSKVALFLRRVFPSREEMSRWYPAPPDSMGIYFYYPARIRDLLLKYGRQAWRLVRGEEGMKGLAMQEEEITPLRDWLMSPGRIPEKRGKV